MKKYYVGSTPYLEWENRNKSTGALEAATSVTCAIYDQTNKLVSTTATETCSASATGIYYYAGFTIGAAHVTGIYKAIATVTDGANITRDDNCVVEFQVVEVGGH